jgi:AcrR family transcriptional regulator
VAKKRLEEVYEIAARLFEEKGYDATSIQDIAAAIGVLKGSLYYYFESKEDLLLGILKDWQKASIPELEKYTNFVGSPAEQLRYMISGYVTWTIDHRLYVALFEREYRSLSPEHQAELVPVRDRYERLMRQLITQGKEQGQFREDVEVKLTTIATFSMINGIPMWYQPSGPYSPTRIASVYADNAVRAISVTSELADLV